METIVGMFFIENDEDGEHYRTGQVVKQVAKDYYLIQGCAGPGQ